MRYFALVISLILFASNPLVAANPSEESRQLKQEKQDAIRLIKQGRQEEWGQLETLKALSRNLRRKSRDIRRLNKEVKRKEKRLEQLTGSTVDRERRINKQVEQLNDKLKALFYLKKVRQLTLLPGQSGFGDYFRNRRQLQKLSSTDAQQVVALQEDLKLQTAELKQLSEDTALLAELQVTQKTQEVTMQVEQKQIRSYLKQLKRNRKNHRRYLREIAVRLKKLDKIAKQRPALGVVEGAQVVSTEPGLKPVRPFTGFSKLKHRLENPVQGKLYLNYGSSERLYKKGILVETEPETVVRCVWIGKVVFAGAFNGLGEMVMVDHGRGSLSIYANLEGVKVKKGDQVATGQPLGGVAQVVSPKIGYLLYFETRYRKRSVNPKRWLKNPEWNEQ